MDYQNRPADMYQAIRIDDRPMPVPREQPVVPVDRDEWPEGLPFPTDDQIRRWQEEIDRSMWEKRQRDLPN